MLKFCHLLVKGFHYTHWFSFCVNRLYIGISKVCNSVYQLTVKTFQTLCIVIFFKSRTKTLEKDLNGNHHSWTGLAGDPQLHRFESSLVHFLCVKCLIRSLLSCLRTTLCHLINSTNAKIYISTMKWYIFVRKKKIQMEQKKIKLVKR